MGKFFIGNFYSIIFLCVFGVLTSPLGSYAQATDPEFQEVETTEPEQKDLETLMEETAEASKIPIDEGVHVHPKTGKKYFVAWGVADIQAANNSKGFINSRQMAFTKAMADAKRNMIKFIGQEIESNMSRKMEQPAASRAEAEADALKADVIGIQEEKKVANAAQADLEKKSSEWGATVVAAGAKGVNRVYQNELDKQLKSKGIDPNKPVDPSQIKAILNSDKFQEITKVMARHKVVGMQGYKTFEVHPKGDDPDEMPQIGVIAIWSQTLNNLGKAIVSGNTSLIPPTSPKAPLKQQISKNPDSLMMTFGVQMKRDENGSPALVSYCQQGQRGRKGKRAAILKAKTCAAKQIRQYAGEAMTSTTQDQNAESETEFEDGSLDYENESALDDLITSTSENMKITGIANLHTWKGKHPLSGQRIRGAVVYWSPSMAKMANSLGGEINAPATKASEMSNQNETKIIKKKQQRPVSKKGFSGSGSSASDDF
jgi:hypothetical protein